MELAQEAIMRWENEGGAVLLRPTDRSTPTRASKARVQDSRPKDQPRDDRHSVTEALGTTSFQGPASPQG